MTALRYLYMLSLVVWLGGMLTVGAFVAPAIFTVLQGAHGQAGSALAGVILFDVLRSFSMGAYACGGVMLTTLAGMRVLGPKPVQFNLRVGIVAAMLGVAVYTGVVVGGQIETLHLQMGGAAAGLAAGGLHRVSVARLHNLSTALMMVNVAGGLALLFWEARE